MKDPAKIGAIASYRLGDAVLPGRLGQVHLAERMPQLCHSGGGDEYGHRALDPQEDRRSRAA